MIDKKGDIISSFGTAVIIVLFMLIFSSFSDKPITQTDRSSSYELKEGFHADQVKAVISEAVSLPSVQKSSVSLLHTIFNDTFKVIANDKTITQGFINLQKMKLAIKPVTFCIFYHHFFAKNADDIPVLS
jgi:hypothetical protein